MLTKEDKTLIKNVWESKKVPVETINYGISKQEMEQAWC